MSWEIFSTLLTAIATVGLVIVGFRQTKIQKTQTDIQNKALKISLLEQRLQCFYNINSMRSYFLIPSDLSNKIGFYNTGSGAYGISDVIKNSDEALTNFSKAVHNSKYLFSVEQYNYLEPLISEIGLFFAENKKIYFNTLYIQASAKAGDKKAQQKVSIIDTWVKNVVKGGNISEKNLLEILDINYEQYIEQQQKIIEKFSSTTFFDTFNEYLNVDKISDNETHNS